MPMLLWWWWCYWGLLAKQTRVIGRENNVIQVRFR